MVATQSRSPVDGRRDGSSAREWAGEVGIPSVGLVTKILRLDMLVTRAVEEITSGAGITLADHLVLGILRWSPDHRSSPTHICEVLGRSSGGMTLTLDRLEAAGWLYRAPDPNDRRRVVVALSEAGLQITMQVNERLHVWESSLTTDPESRVATERKIDELLELFTQVAQAPPRAGL